MNFHDFLGTLLITLAGSRIFCYIDIMSGVDFRSKRADRNKARQLIVQIAREIPRGIIFTQHSLTEMSADNLTTVDVYNVLASSASRVLMDGEERNGSYRYQFGTGKIVIVVCFSPDGRSLTVITAWRKGK